VRKTQGEIPNTNVETLKTEQHMFWSADVERGQPDAYDNTLINKTTELNQAVWCSSLPTLKAKSQVDI
jgi:hypothetical protein